MTVSINQENLLDLREIHEIDEYQYSVVVEHDVDSLAPYLQMLDELATKTIEPNVFYEPWILLPALKIYSSNQAMCFLLVKATSTKDGSCRLAGFFPMELSNYYRGFPMHSLRLWRYPHCFLATPLLHRKYVKECLLELLTWFQSQRRFSLMELHTQSAHGAYYRHLREVLNESPLKVDERMYERAFLSLELDAESYLKNVFSGKFRHENRRRIKRLQELGEVRWEQFPEDGRIEDWTEEFLQLEAAGWKGSSGTAMNLSADDRKFFQTMAAEADKRGRLYMLALRLDDKLLAMIVVLLAEDGAFAFKHTYDENFRRYAPGHLMFVELIQRAHSREDLNWLDSCAAEDNALLNKLFKDRLPMCNLVLAKRYTLAAGLVQLLPVLSRAKKRLIGRNHD